MKAAEQTLEVGFVEMDHEAYIKHPAMSNTGLGYILRSPQHFIAWQNQPPESTPAQVVGTATHVGILEPEKFYKLYVARPDGIDRRTKVGKEAYAEFEAAHAGKIVLHGDDFKRIEAMIESVYSHPTASNLLRGGKAEQSGFWVDPETGIHCKLRCDYFRADNVNVDLKTCQSAEFHDFQRSIGRYGYHRQGAYYHDGLRNITRTEQVGHVLLAVESDAPHAVGVYVLDDEAIGVGRERYRHGLDIYKRCLTTGQWPGYPEEIQTISVPGWAS